MSLLNDDERADIEQNEEFVSANRFKQEQARRGSVVDQLNITNILELSQRDHEVLG